MALTQEQLDSMQFKRRETAIDGKIYDIKYGVIEHIEYTNQSNVIDILDAKLDELAAALPPETRADIRDQIMTGMISGNHLAP